MLLSAPVAFTFRGQDALLRVIHNDGFCWGRIKVVATLEQFDVHSGEDDLYDEPDTDAALRLIELAQEDTNVSAAVGWL